MTEAKLQLATPGGACPRCCLPEDLLPIQQAAVIRSLPPAYATVVRGSGVGDPLGPLTPERSLALEHAAYVGAMFAALYIRLHQLLRRERPEPVGSVVERQRSPGDPQLQLTLSRLSAHAERVAETIMACAPSCDWRAPLSQELPSPHALIHLAIDEAAEHLRDAGSVLLLDAPLLAVAGSGLFLEAELTSSQGRGRLARSTSGGRAAPPRRGSSA